MASLRHTPIVKRSPRLVSAALLLTLLLQTMAAVRPVQAATAYAPSAQADPQAQAAALLQRMSPEERVGQLFLVTFSGASAPAESQIYDLIANYHIGGVVLRRDMDNFVAQPETLTTAHTLIQQLQSAELNSARVDGNELTALDSPAYVPLLVAISQEGDGYPNDQLLDVFSPQPNAMMLGATWRPALAQQAGSLLGAELSALGVNMLIGPSLDVIETPRPDSLGDLGVRSFGGDSYWVGQMGQAYISGVHIGSQNRVAVVAKHLPGYGDSDRPLDEEVPTIRKSLTQLTEVELPPFFAVTGSASSPEATADAMLLAHIRYQGFQGNIRTTTRPLSFDLQAFNELMALPAFSSWREDGGLIISDSLGTRAVRRSYDASEQTFNATLVARDAFLAGNDLLYLGNFISTGDPNSYTTIVRTAQFFAQKYREDVAFAERVDESVLRILTLKYELYPSFTEAEVLTNVVGLESIGQDRQLIFEIGRRAATLLSPSLSSLADALPEPPGRFEQIVFITDSYTAQQCSQCPPQQEVMVNSFAQAVLSLYGPVAGNQITAANLSSFSFMQLTRTLDGNIEGTDPLLDNLARAEWVVINVTQDSATRPESQALRRLLEERITLLENKKVIVFALNTPYYLDATDVTKVTAYYGLYGENSELAEVAARLLFKEIDPRGASPVSVTGVGYLLEDALTPNPDREIAMQVTRIQPAATSTPETTVEADDSTATESPTYQAGDLLSLQAGPVLDHNGNPVPDNTSVTFTISLITEQTTLQRQITAQTHLGIASTTYSIEDEGTMVLTASSGNPPALALGQQFRVAGINPEGLALQATQTAQSILATQAAQTPLPTVQPPAVDVVRRTDLVDWFLWVLISSVAALGAYQTGINLYQVRWGVRWALTTFIGGLFVGCYLALDLPASRAILEFGGKWGLVIAVLGGCLAGLLAGWAWRLRGRRPASGRSSQ
ncbi:MAG TPA: glycoside hydrolase family 3 N-terminal domain-containing protein [Anaerolineales bacterium]|nr:glycoside hydrolase family 3 N-terminal domain-containing protein [Anaerolineales bacterium]HRQ91925.1 glycoside hydrolase family 3 N-terminal domain-containing protein [Anaerolineales bacterium]